MHRSYALILLTLACALVPAGAKAQTCLSPLGAPADSLAHDQGAAERPRLTRRQWLWGAGRASVLDTYLTPLTYEGPDLTLAHSTERLARWGRGRVTTYSLYTGHLAYAASPTDDGKEWDSELTATAGWHYNWRPLRGLRLAAGGLGELSGGFTYNTRGSNNPAQGRLGLSLAASGVAEYSFPLLHRRATARLQADMQLMGVQFAPSYGQSYYEIFSLGHSAGTVHFTQPANCPTVRLQGLVTLPVWGADVTLGYLGDIRQSRLGGLKRHAWRHGFVIGYTRTIGIVRRPAR